MENGVRGFVTPLSPLLPWHGMSQPTMPPGPLYHYLKYLAVTTSMGSVLPGNVILRQEDTKPLWWVASVLEIQCHLWSFSREGLCKHPEPLPECDCFSPAAAWLLHMDTHVLSATSAQPIALLPQTFCHWHWGSEEFFSL